MIQMDEDALICDLAETYGIFDYKSLPARTVATLASGLSDTSRIKRKIAGEGITFERLMLINIYDKLAWIAWSKTQEAHDGGEPPETLLERILGRTESEDEVVFDSGEEFEKYRDKILRGE